MIVQYGGVSLSKPSTALHRPLKIKGRYECLTKRDTMNARKDYAKYFDTKIEVKKTFLGEDAPEDLKEFVQNIHLKHFFVNSNDWVNSIISNAFYDISSNDFNFNNVSLKPDIFPNHLYVWLGEPYAYKFCNECMETMKDIDSIWNIIAAAQGIATGRIYREVMDYIKDGEV